MLAQPYAPAMLRCMLPGLVAVALFAVPAPHAAAQSVVPACNMNCAALQICSPFDARCNDQNAVVTKCQQRQASCQAKYTAYDAYLSQMGAGVTLLSLPALYRDVLAPFYPASNLAEVRFGYSNRQPPGNATCDCDRIYFNSQGYVNAVQAAELEDRDGFPSRFGWLLHELAHFEQCRIVGSRDAYAKMWWDHLSEADFTAMIQAGSWDVVHDQMQMEQQADARRDETLVALRKCCIHPTSRQLIRPLAVQPLAMSPSSVVEGQTVTLSTSVSGGAEPLTYRWHVKRPGAFAQFEQMPASGTTLPHTFDAPGAWRVKLEVLQPPGQLTNNHADEIEIVVAELLPVVTAVAVNPGSVTGGGGAQGTVQLASMKPGASVQVQLESSHAAADVPPSVAVTPGANGTGSASFPITTHLVAATYNVNVKASAAGGSASATLQVQGVVLGGIEFDKTEAHAGELLRVRLLLDRPPTRDLTVVLESTDPRSLQPPANVLFRAGEVEKWVELRVSADLSRALTVTLRARAQHDPQSLREQTIQLRPR